MRLGVEALRVALVLGLGFGSACYSSRHYTDNPRELDNVYFGRGPASLSLSVGEDGREFEGQLPFRNYFMGGLVPPSERTEHFAGQELAAADAEVITHVRIITRKTFFNGLLELGLSAIPIVGGLRPLAFNFRSIEYEARRY